jgi:opacity protein-like surface antigen
MKKTIYASIIALSLVFTANAYSAQGLYVSVGAGLAMPDDIELVNESASDGPISVGVSVDIESDPGAAFIGAVGYKMQNFRVEGEVGYQKNDFDQLKIEAQASAFGFTASEEASLALTGDMTALSFLANVYYDFPTGTKFTPFITAGIGWAEVEVNDIDFADFSVGADSFDDSVFAGQVGAGVSYAITEMLELELKYRYFMTDDLEFEDDFSIDGPASHNVYLGMRFNF